MGFYMDVIILGVVLQYMVSVSLSWVFRVEHWLIAGIKLLHMDF